MSTHGPEKLEFTQPPHTETKNGGGIDFRAIGFMDEATAFVFVAENKAEVLRQSLERQLGFFAQSRAINDDSPPPLFFPKDHFEFAGRDGYVYTAETEARKIELANMPRVEAIVVEALVMSALGGFERIESILLNKDNRTQKTVDLYDERIRFPGFSEDRIEVRASFVSTDSETIDPKPDGDTFVYNRTGLTAGGYLLRGVNIIRYSPNFAHTSSRTGNHATVGLKEQRCHNVSVQAPDTSQLMFSFRTVEASGTADERVIEDEQYNVGVKEVDDLATNLFNDRLSYLQPLLISPDDATWVLENI